MMSDPKPPDSWHDLVRALRGRPGPDLGGLVRNDITVGQKSKKKRKY